MPLKSAPFSLTLAQRLFSVFGYAKNTLRAQMHRCLESFRKNKEKLLTFPKLKPSTKRKESETNVKQKYGYSLVLVVTAHQLIMNKVNAVFLNAQ